MSNWVFASLLSLSAMHALAQAPVASTQALGTTQSTITQSRISASEMVTLRGLGLTESDWLRYQSVLVGPQANWSTDKDPLLVLGITASTDAERARYAELYVEADRKRNAAIFEFTRATQKVWLRKYSHEALFAVPGMAQPNVSAAPLLTANDRVILVIDAAKDCPTCTQVFENVQRLGRQNGGTGIDIYFVASTFDQMVAYGKARGILRTDVSAKRVTLNAATPEVLAKLQVVPGAIPAAFKRTPTEITRISLTSLLGAPQ